MNIRYKGLSLARDEQAIEQGELALCANVELHEGALRSSMLTGTTTDYPLAVSGYAKILIYVHQTSFYRHFIAYATEDAGGNNRIRLYWFEKNGSSGTTLLTLNSGVKLISAESIGNTLIFLTSEGLHYCLWKDGTYKYLGNHLPEVNLSFGLSAELRIGDTFTVKFSKDTHYEVDEADRTSVTEQIFAKLNKFVNDEATTQGKFCHKFFVRYALRLYDGTLTMHSAPILMVAAYPAVRVNDASTRSTNASKEATCNIVAAIHQLDYAADNPSVLNDWSDIVTAVEVFLSAPIYEYDSSERVTTMATYLGGYSYSLAKFQGLYKCWSLNQTSAASNMTSFSHVFLLPKSKQGASDHIPSVANFFLAKSFLPGELSASRQVLDLKDVLPSLTTREQMTDDWDSHDTIYANYSYVYNHRLNLCGISKIFFNGFTFKNMLPYSSDAMQYQCTVYINYEQQTITKTSAVTTWFSNEGNQSIFLYYPSTKAYRMAIAFGSANLTEYYYVDLKPHPFLNGAYYYGPLPARSTTPPTNHGGRRARALNAATAVAEVPMLNKIYTSELNNPFLFPPNSINTVGTGEIRAMVSTTRALSQGQFGQFPLLAFATDGIWALDVSSSGTYSAVHPISREVCSNVESICQLDQSAVFATDRALNKIVSSDVASFSDILNGPFFNIGNKLKTLRDMFVSDPDILQLIDFATPPTEFFQKGKTIYDFVNERILILPATTPLDDIADKKTAILVYSIRDASWSTMLIDAPIGAVNAYPYPFIQTIDGKVMVLDKKYNFSDNTARTGLILTRSLTFSEVMNTITGFSQEADSNTPALLILFGSNDNVTWDYIGAARRSHMDYISSRAYRFFRIALHLKLSPRERYFSTYLNVIQKYAKK